MIVFLFGIQSDCLAQSYQQADDSQSYSAAPALPYAPSPTSRQVVVQTPHQQSGIGSSRTGPPAYLLGAGCGTIGPQGGDATSIMGVNTAGTVGRSRPELPILPTFLILMLSLSLLLFGMRALFTQKGTPLWVVGSIAAGALILAGFLWAFSGPDMVVNYFS